MTTKQADCIIIITMFLFVVIMGMFNKHINNYTSNIIIPDVGRQLLKINIFIIIILVHALFETQVRLTSMI